MKTLCPWRNASLDAAHLTQPHSEDGISRKMEPQRYKGVKLFCFRSDFFFFLESSSGSRQKGACCHQTKYLTESLNSQSNSVPVRGGVVLWNECFLHRNVITERCCDKNI